MSTEHIGIIFSSIHCDTRRCALFMKYIEMILGFNQLLLTELKKRESGWNDSTLIGDVFLKLTPFLKLYTEYSNNYDRSIEFVKQATRKSLAFQEYLEQKRQIDQNVDLAPPLEALLITPIQRIPRYNLLLKDLIKHTSDTHPDYQNLKASLALMQEVADHSTYYPKQMLTLK